jgi:hypothetical protein
MEARGAVPGLWAITSYFNPVRYRRKLENFRSFRRRLTVPLVAVEHAAVGGFDLGPRDADILLRAHGGAVLWQKERLLNLALDVLPRDCDAVAWLDADVILDRPGWADDARDALQRLDLLHLFHERHNLPPDADLGELSAWSRHSATSLSFVHRLAAGTASPGDLTLNNAQLRLGSTAGLAWAARRDAIERHRLYDACIVGGGDRVMLCAALGHLDEGCLTQRMNPRRAEHFLAWARPFAGALAGRVGSLPGRVFHLWHGDLQNRGYEARLAILEDFDPSTDIAIDRSGCWRWSSDKPALHAAVERYFVGRREDGEERSPAPDHCRIS